MTATHRTDTRTRRHGSFAKGKRVRDAGEGRGESDSCCPHRDSCGCAPRSPVSGCYRRFAQCPRQPRRGAGSSWFQSWDFTFFILGCWGEPRASALSSAPFTTGLRGRTCVRTLLPQPPRAWGQPAWGARRALRLLHGMEGGRPAGSGAAGQG